MDCGGNMTFAPQAKPSKYYKKASPETMRKNREAFGKAYVNEIKWLKENLQALTQSKQTFLVEMYTILVTGSRKITPKMESAIKNGVQKCMNNPKYNKELKEEGDKKIKPMLEKLAMVERLCEQRGDRAIEFIQSVKGFVKNNYFMTRKQMEGVNKVYKRVSEDLFSKLDDEDKKSLVKQLVENSGSI